MAKIIYPTSSPYSSTPQTNWSIGLYKHRNIPVSSDDQQVVIDRRYHRRPDLLSFDTYGTWRYWWVFMVRNMNVIRDPIWDFTEGKTIMVPTSATIAKVLG